VLSGGVPQHGETDDAAVKSITSNPSLVLHQWIDASLLRRVGCDMAREERGRENRTRENRQTTEDSDEDLCGLPCFTRRVRKTRVPFSFKLPDSYKIFDGLQDEDDWLVDYLETVKLMGGTRAMAMQSIQVHLSGAARP
jgi:hypothetical protein